MEPLLLCCLAFGQLLSFFGAALPKQHPYLGALVLQHANLLSMKKSNCGQTFLVSGGLKKVDRGIVPSLAPPQQAVPQRSKEDYPARVNT